MRSIRLALILGASLASSVATAGVFTINPTPAPIAPLGGTTPAAIAFVYTPGVGDTTIGFQASIAFNTTQLSATVTNGAGANGTGGGCSVASPGLIRIAAADNNNAPLQTGTYCNLTFTALAGFAAGASALPITIVGGGKGCFDLNGSPTTCTKVDGSLVIAAGNSWAASPNPLAVGSALAGATAGPVNLLLTATAGNSSAGSIASACTFAGADAGSFNTTATFPFALAQTGVTNLPIRFQPPGAAVAGAQTATITCTGAAGTTLTGFPITLNGTVLPPSITAALTPASLTFASTATGGNTATQNVVITAPAGNTAAITINACTIGGANGNQFNFNPAFAAVTLNAGQTANVPVRYSPTVAGAAVGSVSCTTSTASATVTGTVALSGTGVNVWAATPNPLAVGSTLAGGTAGPVNLALTAAASNTGTGSIAAACTFAGADAGSFNTTAVFPFALAQTGVTNLPIRFQPPGAAAAGAQTATINCTGAAGTSLTGFPITLNGTVTAPSITAALTPASLTFASTATGGNTATQNVVITAPAGNTGAITINACTIGGANGNQFNFNPAFAAVTLNAGQTANVPVRYSPTLAGAAVGSVSCTTSTASATVTGAVALSGSAFDTWTASPNPLAVGSAFAGATAGPVNLLLTATASNTGAGSIATACTFAGADAASFNTTAVFPFALAQTGVTNLPIRFQPPGAAAAGAQTATINCTGAAGTSLTGFPITLNGTVLASTISAALTPASLSFASTATGGNTATQNVVITAPAGNTGAITIDACTIGGANGNQFNFNPAFAAVTLNAGQTANVPVRYSPTLAGAAVGSVTCTTSTAAATVSGTVALSGSAFNSWVASPNPLAVGSTFAGGTAGPVNLLLTAAATNTGTGSIATACTFAGADAVSFNTTAVFPLALAQSGVTNLPIRFQPPGAAAAGAQTATINCTGAAGTSLTGFPITLNGTVTAPSITAALTPASLTFASTATGGNTATQNVVITAPAGNTGAITINACTIGGANGGQFNFSPAFAAVTLNAGQTANVPVRYSPTVSGAAVGSVTCTTSTASATVTGTVALSGTGVNVWAATPNPLAVGSTLAGGTAGPVNLALTAAASNTGTGSIAAACTFAGANAASFNTTAVFPFALAQTGVTNLPIRFQPPGAAAAGAQTATVNCTGAAGTSLTGFPITLNGTVTAPSITATLSPASLTFGSTTTGANSATQNVVVTAPAGNTGAITINACTIGGVNSTQFNFSPAFAAVTLNAGQTANVPVRFSPTAAGAPTASVSCTTSTPGATVTGVVALSGTAVDLFGIVSPVTPPGAVTLPGYAVGAAGSSSTSLSFNVTNSNSALACVATGTGYSVTPNPLNLVVGTPGSVTVTFTGATAGVFTGSLTCTPVAPASGGPFVYNLSTTVTAQVAVVAVPALGNFALLALIAGFLGLGIVLVNRRQL